MVRLLPFKNATVGCCLRLRGASTFLIGTRDEVAHTSECTTSIGSLYSFTKKKAIQKEDRYDCCTTIVCQYLLTGYVGGIKSCPDLFLRRSMAPSYNRLHVRKKNKTLFVSQEKRKEHVGSTSKQLWSINCLSACFPKRNSQKTNMNNQSRKS